MITGSQGWFRLMVLAAIFWLCPVPVRGAADSFLWRAGQNQVSADIESWPLSRLLESLASATGWQIYVEPDTQYTVTTRFRRLKPPDALRRLLGELNFALLPQANGPTKLFIYRTSVQEATQLFEPARRSKGQSEATKPIANELILTLKPGSKESIDALAKRLGAKVVGQLDGLNAYRLRFENEAAAQNARAELESDSDVASVEYNYSVAAPGQLQPLSMSSLRPPSFKLNPANASDKLTIALVDTPIQSRGAPWADYLVGSLPLAGDVSLDPNQVTHGTAMMDTLWSSLGKTLQDPDSASIGFLSLDVYGNNETTSLFDVARAIVEAVNRGARIVNLSLGGYGESPLLHEVLSQARAQGVLLVAAAGNEHVTTPTQPAADPNVLAVTSGTKNGTIASYANYGSFVDLIAPGTSVIFYNGQAYLVTGTSAATANASGAAAAVVVNNHQTPIEAGAQITKLPGFAPVSKPQTTP